MIETSLSSTMGPAIGSLVSTLSITSYSSPRRGPTMEVYYPHYRSIQANFGVEVDGPAKLAHVGHATAGVLEAPLVGLLIGDVDDLGLAIGQALNPHRESVDRNLDAGADIEDLADGLWIERELDRRTDRVWDVSEAPGL